MPLDSRYVDMIHTRLLVRYGTAWSSKWAAGTESMVKADWADELGGIRSDAIRHALEHLPAEFPPTATQFRLLCLNAPKYVGPAIEGPKANPQRVAELIARMRDTMNLRRPMQWAYDLQAKEQAGEKIHPGAAAAYREALTGSMDTVIGGTFTLIPVAKLPPGMRSAIEAGEIKVATA